MGTRPKLDSGIEPEKRELSDLTGQTENQVIGIGMTFVVGADWSVIVPRQWLLDQMHDVGLPEFLAPPQPRPSTAYSRAVQHLQNDWLEPMQIELQRLDSAEIEEHEVTVSIKSGQGDRIDHVRAEVFRDAEQTGTEGGEWRQHDLGRLMYDRQSKSLKAEPVIDSRHDLYEIWSETARDARTLHSRFEHSHIASDIRQMIYDLSNKYTDTTIKLQRSTYLFPPSIADLVDDLAELFDRIDREHKHRGSPIAIRTFELIDTDEKQDWVEHRVRSELEESVDDIVESAFDRLDEGEAASQVTRRIRTELNSEVADFAEVYNGLLDAEISVEEVLEEQKQQVVEEREEILEDAMGQRELVSFE